MAKQKEPDVYGQVEDCLALIAKASRCNGVSILSPTYHEWLFYKNFLSFC